MDIAAAFETGLILSLFAFTADFEALFNEILICPLRCGHHIIKLFGIRGNIPGKIPEDAAFFTYTY